ncbi:hypothetical protein [Nesterenkonia marinintestina]|uniref:hypothetical protein n=1 Tax=Nesterenkonia marinintestina TaxID=2979865 RepID=UPI0021BF9DD6|nr:hypothetical protein [Nesterenkonia sp. GX14115]
MSDAEQPTPEQPTPEDLTPEELEQEILDAEDLHARLNEELQAAAHPRRDAPPAS